VKIRSFFYDSYSKNGRHHLDPIVIGCSANGKIYADRFLIQLIGQFAIFNPTSPVFIGQSKNGHFVIEIGLEARTYCNFKPSSSACTSAINTVGPTKIAALKVRRPLKNFFYRADFHLFGYFILLSKYIATIFNFNRVR